MARYKDVKEFEYPSKVTLGKVLKGMWQTSKIDMLFHGLMAILLTTGLIMDLLGVFLGGWLSPIRRIAHGYVGVAFIVVFPIYLIKVISAKKMRLLMTPINYADFVLYLLLILSGIAISSVNQPWINVLPWLPSTLGFLRQIAPTLHTVVTYAWLLVSILLPGGVLHGIATGYLIQIHRRRAKAE